MTAFVLYDDATARAFEPFALTRPCGELRAGAELIRHRWMRAMNATCAGFIGAAHLQSFAEFDAPPALTGAVRAGTWVVNARCAVALATLNVGAHIGTIRVNGRIAAVKLAKERTQIGLGGIAKGYAVDRAVKVLEQAGVRSFFVQAGGDLFARGKKPDGTDWQAGIRDPRGRENQYFAKVPLSDHAFALGSEQAHGPSVEQ